MCCTTSFPPVSHSYSLRPRAHNSKLPGRLSHLVDWYLPHACCFTSHIDTYWHYVLSTVSIMYTVRTIFHVATAFCQIPSKRICYYMQRLTRHLSIIRMTNRRRLCYVILPLDCCIMMSINFYIDKPKGEGKVFPYSLPSIGPGADPGVLAVSPQVTWSESRHRPGSRLPLLSAIARPTCCFILMYTCGLAVVIKRICYVMLCYVMLCQNEIK